MFVEQVMNEMDKNHDENDTERNNDARMYQRKGMHFGIVLQEKMLFF